MNSNLNFGEKKYNLSKEGWIIFVLTVGLTIFGLFMVFSASYYTAETLYGDKFLFLKKQAVGAGLGFFGMIFFMFFDNGKIKKFSIPLVIVSFVLLILVFIPPIGVEKYGAKRWINLGIMTIQPSEIAKFALIVFSATYLQKHGKNDGLKVKLPIIAVGGAMCVLVLLEPNLSITICIALLLFALLVVGGIGKRYILMIFGVGLLAVPILILVEPYRLQRLLAFLDPWASPKGEGYQLIQSLYGIANGGLFGVGYLNSRQALRFLPFAESDFIFPIIAEEFGLFGCIVVLLCFFIIILVGVKIALNADNLYSSYLSFGITILLAIQTVINVAVVTGSIPPTGLPLPFISSGNTQIIMFMSQMGILINISKNKKIKSKT